MTSDLPPASQVRAELDRILASEIFTRSERLSAFLTFIVERTLAGEGTALKEQIIAIEIYGKGPDFNTAADPIVRVDARRLRDRLREYYASAPPGEIGISVPKGSYTPEFTATVRVPSAEPAPPPATSGRGHAMWWVGGAVALAIVVLGAWLANNRIARERSEPVRLLTVTSLPGAEEDPSLSPDGNFVAFSWSENGSLNGDIWVKAVDGDAMNPLTRTAEANEKYPMWSPDGQHIAFTRFVDGKSSVWMVSRLGGPERMIAPRSRFATWLPDGKSIVATSSITQRLQMLEGEDGADRSREPRTEDRATLVRYFLESGAQQQLTVAPAGFLELHPRASPDGTAVAFTRTGAGRSAVFLARMSGGQPTQLVDWSSGLAGGLTWTPDGREVIYSRPEVSGRHAVRFTPGSGTPAVPVPGVPQGSVSLSTSSLGSGGTYRLAFTSGLPDVGLRLVDLESSDQRGTIGAATPFCDAKRMDVPGRFSPDGEHVTFVSDRSGTQQVWVCGRDQSGQHSVTNLQNASVNVGSWSPDGKSIAFDATIAANTDVYVASVDGGPPKQLTHGPSIEIDPEWSHDGRWIYFSSNETGQSEIWKMSGDGRTRLKLTTDGGFDPRESPDGRFVYFVKSARWFGLGPGTRLHRIPTQGGAASPLPIEVVPGAWGLAGETVVFLVARTGQFTSDADVVAVYDTAKERVRELGPLPFRVAPYGTPRFFSVSPDGRWALAAHIDSWDRDIFVLDNFR